MVQNSQAPQPPPAQHENHIYISDNNKSDNFFSDIRPRRLTAILSLFLIIAAVPLALHLLSKPTDLPVKASLGTTLSLSGNQNYSIGQHVSVDVILDPGGKAVTATKLIITYSQDKLKRTQNGLVPNTQVFPSIIQGPVYDICANEICTMAVDLSIGSNPTLIITSKKKIATLNFTALINTNNSGTKIGFGSDTAVYAADGSVGSQKNVLATSNPITIFIGNTTVTGSPTPSSTISPSQTPIPTVTLTPTSTPTVTLSPTATPVPGKSDTFLSLRLQLVTPHDPNTLASISPKHPVKPATVYLYKAIDDPNDPGNQPLFTATDNVTYDSSSQFFINTHFAIGKIPTGTYQLLIKVNQYLRKLVSQGINIQNGQTTNIDDTSLIVGDIDPQIGNANYGNNIIDINDFNALAACFGTKSNDTTSCSNPNAADLDDDGVVDGVDLNLLLRNIATIKGFGNVASIPPPLPQKITDTLFSVRVFLDGIGNAGDNSKRGSKGNMSPNHPTRQILVSVSDPLNKSTQTSTGTVTYDSSTGAFTGTIDMGTLPSGGYMVSIFTPNFLQELVPSLQIIKSGKTNTINAVYLIAGDINGDNTVDIADYKLLISCYNDLGASQQSCSNDQKTAADLNDDGKVDLADYNLLIRELYVHKGD